MCYMFVFFFKQKTAYELRISDWSSDVCSSDLDRNRHLVSHASVLNRARPGPKVFAQAKPGFLKPLPPVCDDRHGAFGQTGVARGKSAPDVPRRWIAARQPVHVGEADGVEHDRRRTEIAGRVAKAAASVFRPFMRQQIG